MRLYPFQEEIISDIRANLKIGKKRALVVSPTGSGKTVMFAHIISSTLERARAKGINRRLAILVHRQELVEQVSLTLGSVGVEHSIKGNTALIARVNGLHAKQGRLFILNPGACVQLSTIQKVSRNADDFCAYPPDIIIIDEAHHAVSSTYAKIMERCPQSVVLGVTATPLRLDGKGLRSAGFEVMVQGKSIEELVAMGYLCPPKIYSWKVSGLEGVKHRMGDFDKGQLDKLMSKSTLVGSAIEHYKRFADEKQAIVFCVSVEHAKQTALQFEEAGYSASVLHGSMKTGERGATVDGFKNKSIRILTSCDLVNEGFDVPAIECAIFLRPTESLALYLQQVGRALRVMEGKKEAIILDHAGNVLRHGHPYQERIWSLDGFTNKADRKKEKDRITIAQCDSCRAWFNGKRGDECPHCQHKALVISAKIDEVGGELSVLTYEQSASFQAMEYKQIKGTIFREVQKRLQAQGGHEEALKFLRGVATVRKYKENWAYKQLAWIEPIVLRQEQKPSHAKEQNWSEGSTI